MEEEKKLYPLHLCPLEDEYSWGTESFLLADLGYRDSLVRDGWLAGNSLGELMDMLIDRIVGDNVYEYYGRQFPFEVKLLKVKGKMPLRAHPNDEVAGQRYDFLGKEKLWYIAQAGDDARICLGFAKDTDASEVVAACTDSSIEGFLNWVKPKVGDAFHIPPGMPHAAFGDVLIAEVSESSPLDFCLCGWGENVSPDEFDQSLDLVSAMDFIDYSAFKEDEAHHHHHSGDVIRELIDLPQFTVSEVKLSDPLHIYSEQFNSALAYTCLSGEASVQVQVPGFGAVPYVINSGETLLVPSEVPDFILAPMQKDTVLLESTVKKREDIDPYINQEAEASLHDDDDECCEDEDCDCHHHHHS